MTVDFTSLLPTLIVGIIGWLIRNAFKTFGEQLKTAVEEISKVKDVQVFDGNRITALETSVEGWHPLRRKTDHP